MQTQAVLGESLRQHCQHPPRILFPFEDQHRVIGETDHSRTPPTPRLELMLEPDVKHFMQIEVTEQRGNHSPNAKDNLCY